MKGIRMYPGGLNYLAVGLICLEVTFGAALAGMFAWKSLHRLDASSETRTAISISAAVVGTLAALVLGLLISTASASLHLRTNDVVELAAHLARLDRLLDRYGPDTNAAQGRLHAWARTTLRELSSTHAGAAPSDRPPFPALEATQEAILALTPHSERQSWLRGESLKLVASLMEARWLMYERSGNDIPVALIAMLIFWLALVFANVGLLAPPNGTVVTIMFLCALAVSGSLFIILEIDHPASGLISISPGPVRSTLLQILS